ncbi:M48 family metallopeptidase [Cytophagaceae bacterium ABcell3]|nr:M48 family metallopeptidase [Cytophagaceae bacterium ABcell3]
MNIKVSNTFKKKATQAIAAILIFTVTYIIMAGLAVALTLACAAAGIVIIAAKPNFLTVGVGAGLISLGFLILIFLIKFIFKKHKTDRTHLTEITREEEPRLFSFIEEIVRETNTTFPKKVYLSPEVNASVFYDSGFWSMFLPVKKNLQIGMGLVNTVSENELKAIIAHELGHFSQKSMKVGSYVYNVNQVIYNMLYENESFEKMIEKWANFIGYFAIFVYISVQIIKGIQWILKKLYDFINLSYMGLSREMEFHADEVAANVAGSEALKTALLRLDLADYSYSAVLSFYDQKVPSCIRSQNIFKEQTLVMNFQAKESNLKFNVGFPTVKPEDLSRYNKSKLSIKDQWASHPPVEERALALDKLNIQKKGSNSPANNLLTNPEKVQVLQTEKIFANVEYEKEPESYSTEDFFKAYHQEVLALSFDKTFNGYYDNKNPVYYEPSVCNEPFQEDSEKFFSPARTDMVYVSIALENDLAVIKQIASKKIKIKSFAYDGQKYKSQEAPKLIPKLTENLMKLQANIAENDKAIYCHFLNLARQAGSATTYTELFRSFKERDEDYLRKTELYNKITEATEFINFTTPFEVIQKNLKALALLEVELKNHISDILNNESYSPEVNEDARKAFEEYLSRNLTYFYETEYNELALHTLFSALGNFIFVANQVHFSKKQVLLNYMLSLKVPKNTHLC